MSFIVGREMCSCMLIRPNSERSGRLTVSCYKHNCLVNRLTPVAKVVILEASGVF